MGPSASPSKYSLCPSVTLTTSDSILRLVVFHTNHRVYSSLPGQIRPPTMHPAGMRARHPRHHRDGGGRHQDRARRCKDQNPRGPGAREVPAGASGLQVDGGCRARRGASRKVQRRRRDVGSVSGRHRRRREGAEDSVRAAEYGVVVVGEERGCGGGGSGVPADGRGVGSELGGEVGLNTGR